MHVEARAWDPLPEESPPARKAFRLYLDLGTGRTLNAAWRLSQGQDGGKEGVRRKTAPSHWEGWYSRYDWAVRASEYDVFLRTAAEDEARAVLKAEILDFTGRLRKQATIFEHFVHGLETALLPQLVRLTREPEAMSARDCAYCIGKLGTAVEVWQVLEGNALCLPQIITAFNGEEGGPVR